MSNEVVFRPIQPSDAKERLAELVTAAFAKLEECVMIVHVKRSPRFAATTEKHLPTCSFGLLSRIPPPYESK